MGLADVIDLLCCPHCQSTMSLTDQVRCSHGHAFDVARQGYVNLLGAVPRHADTASMVGARERFLAAGHFDAIADAVKHRLHGSDTIADVGAGPGFYLTRALGPSSRGLALDVSAAACRRAAGHPRVGAVVADTWAGMPVHDGVLDAVLVVFAPKNVAEFARVLRPGGLLVHVAPGPRHLAELRARYGLLDIPDDKTEALQRASEHDFEPVGREDIEHPLHLDADAVNDVIAMGPNAFHGSHPSYEPCDTTLSVAVSWLRRRAN